MLIVKRKTAQSITIRPAPGADLTMTVAELFASGIIKIVVKRIGRSRIDLAINAPAELAIWREEPDTAYAGASNPASR